MQLVETEDWTDGEIKQKDIERTGRIEKLSIKNESFNSKSRVW